MRLLKVIILILVSAISSMAQSYIPKLPIKVSSNGRYFVDQNNVPWLLIGDSGHNGICNLAQSNWNAYFADRQSRGFNDIDLLAVDGASSCGHTTGSAQDGTVPFNKTVTTSCDTPGTGFSDYDASCPNPAFWAEVDTFIADAANFGLVVSIDPVAWGNEPTRGQFYTNNGSTKLLNFGAFLGARYKNMTNIIWHTGQDFDGGSQPSSANVHLMGQLMAGISSADANHIDTCQINFNESYSNQVSSLDATYKANLTTDFVYTYAETYDETLQAYASSPVLPTILGETNYETGNNTGSLSSPANQFILRQEMYYAMTSGAAGHIWGNEHVNHFDASYVSNLGTTATNEVKYLPRLFNRYQWWNLAPESPLHSIITAGFGTHEAGNNQNMYTATYATTTCDSSTPTFCFTYTPVATTLTVAMSKFTGSSMAYWYDPASGLFQDISGGPFSNTGTQSFTTPGTNADGDHDWLLVIQVQPWSGTCDPSRCVDWTMAGVEGGIPSNITVACASLTSSATAANIVSAISTCPSGQYVSLAAGNYTISGITWPGAASNVVLRGAGANQTNITFTSGVSCAPNDSLICINGAITGSTGAPGPFGSIGSVSWTGTDGNSGVYKQGSTVLNLSAAPTGLQVGWTLMLTQADDTTVNTSALWVGQLCSANPGMTLDPTNDSNGNGMEQNVRVVAINGSTVTIWPGIYSANYNSGKSPLVYWIGAPITRVGIENLSISESGAQIPISFNNAANGWIRGVAIYPSSANPRAMAHFVQSRNMTLESSWIKSSGAGNQQNYGIELFDCSGCLVNNAILENITTPSMNQVGTSGSVIAYTYSIIGGTGAHDIQLHDSGNIHILVEGAIASGVLGDTFHGPNGLITLFRNRLTGNGVVPVDDWANNRYWNVIGNVLGISSNETTYECQNPSSATICQTFGSSGSFVVYRWGYPYVDNSVNFARSCNTINGDTQVHDTSLRWGNVSILNSGTSTNFLSGEVPTGLAQYANAVPASHNLQPSLYLLSKPQWWGVNKPFPLIGPDIANGNLSNSSGFANTNAALDCYTSNNGNISSFNASSCFPDPLGSAIAPTAPAIGPFVINERMTDNDKIETVRIN